MRWFTSEWASGELTDEEWEGRRQAYATHLSAIEHELRNGAEELIASVYLHDAQILNATTDGATFKLRVLAGDLQRGYERLSLVYEDAVTDGDVGSISDADVSEIIYDEVDLSPDSRFEHRLLLYPEGELCVRFRRLRVERQPASATDRR